MYHIQDFKHLLGLKGLSDTLLTNHFALYEGYVNNTNRLDAWLKELVASDQAVTPEYAELKRRFGWEWNGMRLHELYFGNLTKQSDRTEESDLYKKVTAQFGSADNWERDFRATGAMRGVGWVILAYDVVTGTLINTWVNEHDGGHLSGTTPLLVMDVFEHAFMLDYGIKRTDYIETFFKSIDWKIVSARYDVLVK